MPSSYQPASEQQTFYPTHRGSMLVFGSFILLLAIYLLGTALTSGADQSLGSRFAYLIPLLGGGSCLALGLTSKLHLSPSGLDFFQLGLHAATPWSNMETLTVAQVGPARITIVRLRQPARIVWVWHPAGYRERVLQLPFNGYDLGEKSALRAALQHYAPHLLD